MAYLLKLRTLGNAWILTIPRQVCRELAWPPGTYVVLRRRHDGTITLTRLKEYAADARRPGNRPPA